MLQLIRKVYSNSLGFSGFFKELMLLMGMLPPMYICRAQMFQVFSCFFVACNAKARQAVSKVGVYRPHKGSQMRS